MENIAILYGRILLRVELGNKSDYVEGDVKSLCLRRAKSIKVQD